MARNESLPGLLSTRACTRLIRLRRRRRQAIRSRPIRASDSKASDPDDRIFDLLPPKPAEDAAPDPEPQEPEPQGRNVHPVDVTDLSRLSIDYDGRLYWDGKPVEVRRRISMSQAQVVGASIVAPFVVIGALASAIQGVVAAREFACQFGWSASACTLPGAVQPRHGSDIPA
jgi:hypothetical protein